MNQREEEHYVTASLVSFLAARVHDAFLPGIDGSLGAVEQVQFAQDVADVPFDRVLGDDQFFGNQAVRQTIGDQLEHIHLALGQLV